MSDLTAGDLNEYILKCLSPRIQNMSDIEKESFARSRLFELGGFRGTLQDIYPAT
jgi:hypothetical protein